MIKVAALIDGSFFIHRYRSIERKKADNNFDYYDATKMAKDLFTLALNHTYKYKQTETTEKYGFTEDAHLYRILYYDAKPIEKLYLHPLTNKNINYKKN